MRPAPDSAPWGSPVNHLFWLVPKVLAGRCGPDEQPWQLDRLRKAGIGAVLSVNDGELCYPEDFEEHGLVYACIPLSRNAPPQHGDLEHCLDALRSALSFVRENISRGVPVLVHCTAGKDRTGLFMSSAKRSRSLPAVPTVIESGLPGFEAGSWFGFFAPKGTPEPIVAQLNKTVNEILALPSIERQMISQGADPVGGTPADFGQFVQREYEKWKLVVRESGATAE